MYINWRTNRQCCSFCDRSNITCCLECILHLCQHIADFSAAVISPAAMNFWLSKARSQLTGHDCRSSSSSHCVHGWLLYYVYLCHVGLNCSKTMVAHETVLVSYCRWLSQLFPVQCTLNNAHSSMYLRYSTVKYPIVVNVLEVLLPSVLWRCWLGGRKGIWPVKNWAVGCWHGYLSGARCRLAYGPADATATHCLLLQ